MQIFLDHPLHRSAIRLALTPFPEAPENYPTLLRTKCVSRIQRMKPSKRSLIPSARPLVDRCKKLDQLIFVQLTRYSRILENLSTIRGKQQSFLILVIKELASTRYVTCRENTAI